MNLQHRFHIQKVRSGNQTLDKKRKENTDSVSSDVDDLFKSIIEIIESVENSNEKFEANERTIGNNANGNNIVSMHQFRKKTKTKKSSHRRNSITIDSTLRRGKMTLQGTLMLI